MTKKATFRNPLLPTGPDPWMVFHDGFYYLMATSGRSLIVRRAPHIAGLSTAEAVTVYAETEPARGKQMWAGEFHLLDGPNGRRWYLYYTASDGVDDHHRLYVLEADDVGGTPLGPYHFKAKLKTDPDDKLYALDPDVFVAKSGTYLCWAGHPGHLLFIQKMSDPWTTTGKRTQLPASGFGCPNIREGPCGLVKNGKVFLFYSACDTGEPDYKLGLLIADESADLTDVKSWAQHPKPVLARSDRNGVYGPGHNGVFTSPDGTEDWIVYHAKKVKKFTYGGRSTRAQKLEWVDGVPVVSEPVPLDVEIEVPSGDMT